MAYVVTNPPKLMTPSIGGGPQVFYYSSADVHGTVEGAGYFTDGKSRGMRLGDIVYSVYTTGYLATLHSVSVVSAAGAVTVSAAVLA